MFYNLIKTILISKVGINYQPPTAVPGGDLAKIPRAVTGRVTRCGCFIAKFWLFLGSIGDIFWLSLTHFQHTFVIFDILKHLGLFLAIFEKSHLVTLSKGFDGIPNFIDASFVWSGNGLIYFFKNGDYYRYSGSKFVSYDAVFQQ